MYWANTPHHMLETIAAYCKDKHILDLGCGDGSFAQYLISSGAKHVTGVDKEPCSFKHPQFSFHQQYFNKQAPLACDIVLLSWPINNAAAIPGILALSQDKPTIVLGALDYATVIGNLTLWTALSRRELHNYLATAQTSLHIYGPDTKPRSLTPHEQLGTSPDFWGF